MLPFSVSLTRGESAHTQILAAVREAFASGQLRDGDPFPSARVLSQELKVSPSTAQRVVDQLTEDGFLTQLRGSGLLVRTSAPADWVSELNPTRQDLGSADGDEVFLAETVVDAEGVAGKGVAFPFLTPSGEEGVEGRIDNYDVIRLLARGGMGMVFEAFDRGLMRKVAIKVLIPQLAASEQSRARFLREARAVAAIDHEHVLPVHAVGEANGFPYLVMPLVEGESLHALLDREGPVPIPELLRIAVAVAKGLAAAHDRKLVHRDIKPDNVLLESGPAGRIWLADFGLARAVHDRDLTVTGSIAGTPQFTSPEQAEGKEVDLRTDFFSFGSLLYAMATGKAPFEGENHLAILRKIVDEEPPTPRAKRPELPQLLEDLILELLRKDPDQRPAGAHEIVKRLEEAGGG